MATVCDEFYFRYYDRVRFCVQKLDLEICLKDVILIASKIYIDSQRSIEDAQKKNLNSHSLSKHAQHEILDLKNHCSEIATLLAMTYQNEAPFDHKDVFFVLSRCKRYSLQEIRRLERLFLQSIHYRFPRNPQSFIHSKILRKLCNHSDCMNEEGKIGRHTKRDKII
jgi:hypothetical protein